MAKKADTPCNGCGKMLWSGPRSKPADERLCRTCRTPAAEPELDQEPPAEPARAEALGPRAARLWRDVTADTTLTPVELVLLEEACRIADRCDRLDAFLRGREDTWLAFHARNDDGTIVEVVVDKALAEARQQQGALKGLVAELRASRAGKTEEPKPEATTRRDELAKRREERRRSAAV